jgi:hypothetical protein
MLATGATPQSPASRHWAAVICIVVGVTLLGVSIWPSGLTASAEATRETPLPDVAYVARALSGGLSLAAVLVAQRWRRRALSRLLLWIASAALLAALVLFNDLGARSLLTLGTPAVLLMIASLGIGPMPRTPAGAESSAAERSGPRSGE